MKMAVEVTNAIHYMLCCLSVKVEHAMPVCGDNLEVIQNSTVADSLLKKKHVAIAHQKTRESTAVGITHPVKTNGHHNFGDILTKPQTRKDSSCLVRGI